MLVTVKKGRQSIQVQAGRVDTLKPQGAGGGISSLREAEIVDEALSTADPPLEHFIRKGASVAVVVSDHTRPTGSGVYVPRLVRALELAGAGSVTVVIALGLHRPPARDEIEEICGGPLSSKVRIVDHDPFGNLEYRSRAGFNREAMQADRLIVTGAVTFHPMAGYSGGRKSLLPGIAAAEDIYANHRLYFDGFRTHAGVGPAAAEGNPVLQDILDRTQDCGTIWALNVVLNEQNSIEFAACGLVDQTWRRCCEYVQAMHTVPLDNPYQTVIASAGGAPSDLSFYQSMKVLTNSSRACTPGGKLIVISDCTAGWEVRPELFAYFSLPNEEIAARLLEEFSMDGLSLYMALSIIRRHETWLYSSLPAAEVESAGLLPVRDANHLESLIARLAAEGDAGYRAAFLENGSLVMPLLSEEDSRQL